MTKAIPMTQHNVQHGQTHPEVVDALTMQKILSKRAMDLSSRTRLGQPEKCTTAIITFFLGEEKYAISLHHVSELMAFPQCAPVPEAPSEILGVMNHRGDIRTIVDLSKLLGLPSHEEHDNNPFILIVRINGQKIGLKTDLLESVSQVNLEECVKTSLDTTNVTRGYVLGVTPDNVIVLSMEGLSTHKLFQGMGE